jgi:hypothetical protein
MDLSVGNNFVRKVFHSERVHTGKGSYQRVHTEGSYRKELLKMSRGKYFQI